MKALGKNLYSHSEYKGSKGHRERATIKQRKMWRKKADITKLFGEQKPLPRDFEKELMGEET